VSGFTPPLDFVVASECIYNLRYGDVLLRTLRDLAGPETVVLFAYAERQPTEEAHFLDSVKEHFEVSSVCPPTKNRCSSNHSIFFSLAPFF